MLIIRHNFDGEMHGSNNSISIVGMLFTTQLHSVGILSTHRLYCRMMSRTIIGLHNAKCVR